MATYPKLDDQVFIAIESDRHPETWVFGDVVAVGLVADNPDAYWVEIEGLTARFYSDKVRIKQTKKKKGK
jgi:hypothetical protein